MIWHFSTQVFCFPVSNVFSVSLPICLVVRIVQYGIGGGFVTTVMVTVLHYRIRPLADGDNAYDGIDGDGAVAVLYRIVYRLRPLPMASTVPRASRLSCR